MSIHTSLSFAQYLDTVLDAFAESVITNLTDNPNFPSQAVSPAELRTTFHHFRSAMAGHEKGRNASDHARIK